MDNDIYFIAEHFFSRIDSHNPNWIDSPMHPYQRNSYQLLHTYFFSRRCSMPNYPVYSILNSKLKNFININIRLFS